MSITDQFWQYAKEAVQVRESSSRPCLSSSQAESIVPRIARDGTFLGYIGSCIDILEHREIQSELRRRLPDIAELNRQAEAAILSASVAHEIRQPLMAIVANASAGLRWLGRETPDVERGRAALNNIVQAGHRAGEIIDSILALNKKRIAPVCRSV